MIACYGMGLTQHRSDVLAIQMLSNFLLMRGNIGKAGAGIFPVRGHSNVQGQRTVGITEKPELAPLDRLAAQYSFEPPRMKGLDTVEACRGILGGTVKAFVGLGGNFVHAVPETVWPCWVVKKLRPLPAHSMNAVSVVDGRRRNCFRLTVMGLSAVGDPCSPAPNSFNRQASPSMVGVLVWLRTKNRSIGTR